MEGSLPIAALPGTQTQYFISRARAPQPIFLVRKKIPGLAFIAC
jgi:hypothetical protein